MARSSRRISAASSREDKDFCRTYARPTARIAPGIAKTRLITSAPNHGASSRRYTIEEPPGTAWIFGNRSARNERAPADGGKAKRERGRGKANSEFVFRSGVAAQYP